MADIIRKETFTIKLTYEMSVNIDTGEILETKLINRSVDNSNFKQIKSSKQINVSDKPTLSLEDNKYILSPAAVELMRLSEDSRLDIRYEQNKDGDIPIIYEVLNGKGGNKITKSNTVSYRGDKNKELAKRGKEFNIVSHPQKQNVFMLISDSKPIQLVEDNNIKIEGDESEDIPFDLDLEDLVDNTEIDSSFFKF